MSPASRNNATGADPERLLARKSLLQLRARVLQALRVFFTKRGYLEVETPYLIPAPAPELHIDAVAAGGAFLHTSPELCMKRLLSAGYPRIFQIAKCFREGERGGLHLPEFTLLEWYRAGFDYTDLMKECEELIRFVAEYLGHGEVLTYQGREVKLERPWERLTLGAAFERYAHISVEEALESGRFDEILALEIEPHLGSPKPVFLYDYPAPLAALSRLKPGEDGVAERFELYLGGGLELANAFTELTDAREQEERFLREREKRASLGKKTYPLPERFLEDLPRMPPSAGIALGVDRLVMFFGDTGRIDDVVTFTPEEL
ncbi:MAG: EF-P lysine aminoacylase GenX [Deltaproteobacteria bacterium]|nr:EF-P lysine aminoacylase GenX [Deltaproteobacteria bacterium]MBW2128543.1 EF-P lysine aminoacylase GenX [Deltaproteobacteria bacterium]MBW2303333.1 EF-P lysine aminoacylase GenX [Deltaproteobacteria bacterium]